MLFHETKEIIRNYLVASKLVGQWPGSSVFAKVNCGHVEGVAQPRNSSDACNFVMWCNIRELRAFVFFDQLFIHYYIRTTLREQKFHHVVIALETVRSALRLELRVQTMCPCRGWYVVSRTDWQAAAPGERGGAPALSSR